MGWSELENGKLLAAAEVAFDVLVTTDQNIRYQQNLSARSLAVLVLMTTSWPRIRSHVNSVSLALDQLKSGEYRELAFS